MLETKNLRKIYTPKKGVPVVALDGISLRFPERGMVFLLGKSGSGKSTLLNLLGGLDRYDEGEIIIKGVSSRDFSQERFDSYRNTYVGFIFQDYNILEEFSVGANIALALELQGKKATDEEISRILDEVDLAGYGNRKPNELSGGQLQRVAIARALVKSPEIIMADEPTGALDSNTGRQVFDTLKKLSAEKLVIIVSHDREYAEHYADRIIELADGHVISDVEYVPESDEAETISYDGDTVTIPQGYHLTEDDRRAINEYVDRIKSGTKLHFKGLSKKFRDTDTSAIKSPDPSKFALIKSRLPIRSAFRIGGNGLGHKKFRLAFTILLSVVAFALFALVDTFGAYDHVSTCTRSLIDSGIPYLSVEKAKKIVYSSTDFSWYSGYYMITDEEIADMTATTGVPFTGVFVPTMSDLSFNAQTNDDMSLYTNGSYNIYTFDFSGVAEIDNDKLSAMGYTMKAGRLPTAAGEIAISEYAAETFVVGGYCEYGSESAKFDKIGSAADMVGRTLHIADADCTVVGVIDTKWSFDRYKKLTESDERDTNADMILKYALSRELGTAREYSLSGIMIVSPGTIAKMMETEPTTVRLTDMHIWMNMTDAGDGKTDISIDPSHIGRLSDVKDEVVWVDGKPRTELGEHEIIVSSFAMNAWTMLNEYESVGVSVTPEMYDTIFAAEFDFNLYSWHGTDMPEYSEGWRVVGMIDESESDEEGYFYYSPSRAIYVNDAIYDRAVGDTAGDYAFAVGPMPESTSAVRDIVEWCYTDEGNIRFEMQNPVSYELDSLNDVLQILADVFLWIGVGFAVFASLMLANFIGTSIAYKKQEIGILRAIGARSGDVFNIFFAEGFIIAMINFVLASAATFTITAVINYYVRTHTGILITALTFGIRQIALVFAIALCVTAVSCFLPVKKIASKRPIDAIRGR